MTVIDPLPGGAFDERIAALDGRLRRYAGAPGTTPYAAAAAHATGVTRLERATLGEVRPFPPVDPETATGETAEGLAAVEVSLGRLPPHILVAARDLRLPLRTPRPR